MDLGAAGYTKAIPKGDIPDHPWFDPLCFSSDSTLIASFVTQEGPQPLARRGTADEPLPYSLHALFLDSGTGQHTAERQWPIPHRTAGILCAPDRKFIVAAGRELILYSPEMLKLGKLALSSSPAWFLSEYHQSPSRKSILLDYGSTSIDLKAHIADLRQYTESIREMYWWVDAGNLAPAREWVERSEPLVSVSDTETITRSGTNEQASFAPMIGELGGPRRVLCSGRDCGVLFRFANDQTVVLFDPHGLRLITARGEPVSREQFPGNEWVGGGIDGGHYLLRTSSDGKRFAVTVWAHKGGSEILDLTGRAALKRIVVFDIPSRRWIYTLDAKKQNIKTITGLALSPDGSLLALIDQDGILQVYRLPPESSDEIPAPPH